MEWFASKGADHTVELNKGGSLIFEGIKVTMTHAVHSSPECMLQVSARFSRRMLTVNRNGTSWLFIRADVGLLSLGEMLVGRLVCAIAVDSHHI